MPGKKRTTGKQKKNGKDPAGKRTTGKNHVGLWAAREPKYEAHVNLSVWAAGIFSFNILVYIFPRRRPTRHRKFGWKSGPSGLEVPSKIPRGFSR